MWKRVLFVSPALTNQFLLQRFPARSFTWHRNVIWVMRESVAFHPGGGEEGLVGIPFLVWALIKGFRVIWCTIFAIALLAKDILIAASLFIPHVYWATTFIPCLMISSSIGKKKWCFFTVTTFPPFTFNGAQVYCFQRRSKVSFVHRVTWIQESCSQVLLSC